jgi:hypothetical protein
MRVELPHFYIDSSYGGNQDWFRDPMMKLGGCAAETACDTSIYLDLYKGVKLYPFDKNSLSKSDYIKFGGKMKPYLHPRFSGIDRLSIYIDGFTKFLRDSGSDITLSGTEGFEEAEKAKKTVKSQLDSGLPVPYLCLHHGNPAFKEYEWHWFLLNGYEEYENTLMVKAVTYGEYEWLNFDELWNTSLSPKGGLISITL